MASGIHVTDKCIKAYEEVSQRKFSIVVLKVNGDMTEVEVDKRVPVFSDNIEGDWLAFTKTLPHNDCRFVIADFVWRDTPTVTKSKLCLIFWSPESSPIKSKMVYASSKSAVTDKAVGLQRSIQVSEYEEMSYKSVKNQIAK